MTLPKPAASRQQRYSQPGQVWVAPTTARSLRCARARTKYEQTHRRARHGCRTRSSESDGGERVRLGEVTSCGLRFTAPCDLRAQPRSQTLACARCAERAGERRGGVAAQPAGAGCAQRGVSELMRRLPGKQTAHLRLPPPSVGAVTDAARRRSAGPLEVRSRRVGPAPRDAARHAARASATLAMALAS